MIEYGGRRAIRHGLTGAVVATVLLLAGCSTKSTPGSNGTTASTASTASTGAGGSSTPPASTGSTSGAVPGVTATTIRVGITYEDLAAISKQITITHGNYRDAYGALIDAINASGGIDGRQIVPYYAPVNPIGTAPAAAACTQLTEDDKVFVVLGFFNNTDPLCYLDTHGVNIIGADDSALSASEQAAEKATWFDTLLNPTEAVPKEIDVFNQKGAFTGHKVGVVGATTDRQQIQDLVLPELRRLGVNVVQTAINSASPGDTAALDQQTQLIAEKFQASGVDVLVGVGSGSDFMTGLDQIHSNYKPRIIATDYPVMLQYISNKVGYEPSRLVGALGGYGSGGDQVGVSAPVWESAGVQSCVAKIKAAHPDDVMTDPATATSTTGHTWIAPEEACTNVSLLEDILKAAGSHLTYQSFLTAGESLENLTLPGSLGTLNYGPGHHDGNGPVYLYTWIPATKSFASSPVNT